MKRFLKRFLGTLGSLIVLVAVLVLLVWSFPEKILTSERVSGWLSPLVRFERVKEAPYSNSPMVTLEITKSGFSHRSFSIRLAPGCYSLATDPPEGSSVCVEAASFGVSFRLSRRHYLRFTGLDHFELHVSSGRFVERPEASKEEAMDTPSDGLGILRYLDRGFAWGPIAIQVDRFDLPGLKTVVTAKINAAEEGYRGKVRSPKLAIEASAYSSSWNARLAGDLFQKGDIIVMPNASVSYRTKAGTGSEVIALAGEINGEYGLSTGDLDGGFSVVWKNPTSEIEAIRADDGSIRMRKEELSASATAKVLLQGKTPLGRLPLLTTRIGAKMQPTDQSGNRPIDFELKIESYKFAGVHAHSDLEFTLIPAPGKNVLRWRKGGLRVETADFAKTIRLLSRTSWAIPVPFNVFKGPIALHTEPFRESSDRTSIPAVLITDLRSTEQILATETRVEIDIGKKNLALLGININMLLKSVQFRLPDYEPLAPVPALARDPRIVRYADPGPSAKPDETRPLPAGPPLTLNIRGSPGSIVLLNRYFDPRLTAGIDLTTDPVSRVIKGTIDLAAPFDLHYLNSSIRFERLIFAFRPKVEVTARVSMERSGYRIVADLYQRAGKTHIELNSSPPLSESEIVSLILYGIPGNSITSEQTRSVGSAQAAMSSEALGIFSFWAFATTPIESVLYDPGTQTYSAVVRLPGGIVALIGSNWDNERQLALSKSIGKNWAVSTELIKDSQGVDRGGTLLRWRRRY